MNIRTASPAALVALLGCWVTCGAAPSALADAAVARVGGDAITDGELARRAEPKYAHQQRIYEAELRRLALEHERALYAIRVQELEHLIDERALALGARARAQSPAQLLATVPRPVPTDAEMRAFYAARQAQIGAPFEIVSDAIRERLVAEGSEVALRRFYADLRRESGAEVLLEPLRSVVEATGPTRGPADATVTLVEFADFQCPYCIRLTPTLDKALAAYPGAVRRVFRQLPLTQLHPDAQRAAEASVCAEEQHHFWEFHDAAFAAGGRLDPDALLSMAQQIGLDMKTFGTCLASERPAAAVKRDVQAADELAIGGTPALFVNGRFLSGALPFEDIVAVIDDELRRARGEARAHAP